MKGIKIDPTLLDPKEVDVLEDLIVAALHDAQAKAEEKAVQEEHVPQGSGVGLIAKAAEGSVFLSRRGRPPPYS